MATRAAAKSAGLDFVPLLWESFDLLMRQRCYFRPSMQALVGFLREDRFRRRAADLTGYDTGAKQFLVTVDKKEIRIEKLEVACIVQLPSATATKAPFRIGLHDGSRLSGELAKVENEKLYFERRGIDATMACPVSSLRSLVGLKRGSKSAPYAKDRTGRWESKGVLSLGTVAAAAPNEPYKQRHHYPEYTITFGESMYAL